jgi:protein-S-isoprenylcysteine O-methyltransferase Ste14
VRATKFEFRHRFWIIMAIYVVAFSASAVDHRNATAWLAGILPGTPFGSPRVLLGIATLCVAAAAGLRTWGAAYLHSDVVHDGALHTDVVVADGPYRHVRNPLYLGTLVQGAGFGLIASRLGAVLLVSLMSLFVWRLIGREEVELLETQGDRYRAFAAAVPAFLPALRPRLPASGRRPAWSQAFIGEVFAWTLVPAIGSLIVARGPSLFYALLGIGLTGYALTARAQRRRRPSAR